MLEYIVVFMSLQTYKMGTSNCTNKKIIIGLSGGVDSSVAAWLLKQQGFQVEGLFMKNWEEDNDENHCSYADDLRAVKQVSRTLDIPLHTINFAHEYWESVFQYFLAEYQTGRTPNPDILCNTEIKFKCFLEHALNLGADMIATGHYVSGTQHQIDNQTIYMLKRAADQNKDQSYFLHGLNQYQLKHSLFPLGQITKPEVRQVAKQLGLVTHNKKDSTGICFIGERRFKTFLQDYLPAQPGDIISIEGNIIGKHEGLMYYTLGQRQGLGIGGQKNAVEKPWYVAAKDLSKNQLIVVQGHDHPWLFANHVNIDNINWISGPPLTSQITATAKVRYRHKDEPCKIHIHDNQSATVIFEAPQWAVTPGQSLVIYDGDICLGGGIIESTNAKGGLLNPPVKKQMIQPELA